MTKTQRRRDMEQVDGAMDRLLVAKTDPAHPQHEEAQRLSYKLATDFSVPAKTLLELSSFWK